MRNSVEAYFKKINNAGGVNGRKLVLEALDDGYEATRAVENTNTLIHKNRVFAMVASYGSSPTTESMNNGFGPSQVPLVGTISGADTLRGPISKNPNLRYMFNVRASYRAETQAVVDQLVSLGIKNIAVFYQDDGFGQSGLDGINLAMSKQNMKPSAVATVKRNSVEVQPAVDVIAKVNPQAVIMVTLYKPTAEFVKAMKKAGQHPQLIALSPVGADLLVKELGDDARGIGISQVMPYPWSQKLRVVREYQQLIGEGENNYSYYGIEGYMMARVLVEGLRNAGKNPTREGLVAALEGLRDWDIGGYVVSYGSQEHVGSNFVDISVIGSGGRVLR